MENIYEKEFEKIVKEHGKQIKEITAHYKREQTLLKNKIKEIKEENDKIKEETKGMKIQNSNHDLFAIRMKYYKQIQEQKEENEQIRENVKSMKKILEEKLVHLQKNNNELQSRIASLRNHISKMNNEIIVNQKKNNLLQSQLNRFRQELTSVTKHVYDSSSSSLFKSEILRLLRDHVKLRADDVLEEEENEEIYDKSDLENYEVKNLINNEPSDSDRTDFEHSIKIEDMSSLIDISNTQRNDEFSNLYHQIVSIYIIPQKIKLFSSLESLSLIPIPKTEVKSEECMENSEGSVDNKDSKVVVKKKLSSVHMWSLDSPKEIFRIFI